MPLLPFLPPKTAGLYSPHRGARPGFLCEKKKVSKKETAFLFPCCTWRKAVGMFPPRGVWKHGAPCGPGPRGALPFGKRKEQAKKKRLSLPLRRARRRTAGPRPPREETRRSLRPWPAGGASLWEKKKQAKKKRLSLPLRCARRRTASSRFPREETRRSLRLWPAGGRFSAGAGFLYIERRRRGGELPLTGSVRKNLVFQDVSSKKTGLFQGYGSQSSDFFQIRRFSPCFWKIRQFIGYKAVTNSIAKGYSL